GFPDLVTLMFMGLFAPGATPRPVIDQIAAATRAALADKEFQKKLIQAGFEPVTDSGPEQTAAFVQEELKRWTPLLKAAGNTLNRRVEKGNEIRHVRVGREAETIAICAGAFFGGVRSVAIFGNTGLLTCTGEMATLCLRHAIPVFCIVSGRGSIDDHKVYQEVQGRRTIPLLQAYDYPYKV